MHLLSELTLTGRLLEGPDGTYYRARSASGEPAILLLLRNEPPGPEELTRLQREHDLRRELADRGAPVLRSLGLLHGDTRIGLVLEHAEGEPLGQVLARGPLPAPAALRIGIELSKLLEKLHERGLLHGVCDPDQLLVRDAEVGDGDAASPIVVLGCPEASRIGEPPAELAASALPYAAPEQISGGAGLTPSADLYSLGALLVHLLSGAPPFESEDPVELVHSHLARTPPALGARAPGTPPALERVVEKLLAKAPEDRYRGARGLRADLVECAARLARGDSGADFVPGLVDPGEAPAPRLPDGALRGEEQALLEALAAARAGSAQVALLTGEAGSGKTVLGRRLAGPARAAGGHFVEVRGDADDRMPHAALSRALRDLTRQILREAPERVSALRRELLPALGPGAQALCDLAPELGALLGALPAAPRLDGAPAQNRLKMLCGGLLACVARPERPLVVFLDDAQWIDAGSMRLLTDGICASPSLHLLLVAAQREDAGEAGHLAAALGALRAAGVDVRELRLPAPSIPVDAAGTESGRGFVPEAERAEAHLRIGRLLLAGGDPASLPDRTLLAGVNQLNLGAAHLDDAAARERLAGLNLLAGQRARAAAANEAAAELFRKGLELLSQGAPDPASGARADLDRSLQRELAEAEFLCGRFLAADERALTLLEQAATPFERAAVQALRARYYLPAGRYKDALEMGLSALSLLGVELPQTDAELAALAASQLAAIGPELAARGESALLDLPVVQDPAQRLRFTLIGLLLPPSFAARPPLFQALVAHALAAILEHGNTEEACTAYFSYGLLQVTTGDIARGLALSELARRLYERLDVHRTAGMVLHIHGGHINHWGRPLSTSVPILEESIQVSMAVGDLNHIGNGAFEMVWLLHERGDRLDEVERAVERGVVLARQIRNEAILGAVRALGGYVRCLSGETEAEPPVEAFCRETEVSLRRMQQAGFGPGICTYHILHLALRYLFGQYEEALAAARAATAILRPVQSLPIEVTLHLFRGLTAAQRLGAGDRPPPEAAAMEAWLREDLEKLARWAAACPDNYEPAHCLLAAEAARIQGRALEAEELYDRAILGAQRSGFAHHAALANELAARFYAQRGRRLIAPTYLRAAHLGYVLWGARRKAALLAEQHPELSAALASGGAGAPQLGALEAVDLSAMVRIGQAVAGELDPDRVVQQLLRVALRHAGATRCGLVLLREGEPRLVATLRAGATPDAEDGGERMLSVPLRETKEVPVALIEEVAGAGEPRLVADAGRDARLASDASVRAYGSRAALALPLVHRGAVTGVLYLENSLSAEVFGGERMHLLESLCAQAATALENAALYTRLSEASDELRRGNERLEREVQQRTEDLRRANEELARELAQRAEDERARAELQDKVIRVQRELLAELSTPLVPVAESIMVMPLLGTVDRPRAQEILDTLLREASASGARVVLIDLTGQTRVDEAVVSLLLKASQALRLLGAQTILTGMRPAAAQTMVRMGVDLAGVVTRADLRSGIAYASALVGSPPRLGM